MATSQQAGTVDSLPTEVLDTILSHLLPPNPPLPRELLSKSFLDRHTFLPPSGDDDDTHLSPFPFASQSADSSSLFSTLYDLTRDQAHLPSIPQNGHQSSLPIQYSHDGEGLVARSRLRFSTTESDLDRQGVDVLFELEAGEKSRGWVYRGAVPADGSGSIRWFDDINHATQQALVEENGEAAPDDYWAGFSPAKPTIEIDISNEDLESGYWAQYGQGVETPGLPGGLTPAGHGARTPDAGTSPTKTTHANLLMQSNGSTSTPSSPVIPTAPSHDAILIRDKLLGQILALLRQAWSSYSADYGMEEAAMDWLRITREIVDRPSWEREDKVDESMGVREAVMRARVEAALRMFVVLDNGEGDKDVFWRMLEKAITIPQVPPHEEVDENDHYES